MFGGYLKKFSRRQFKIQLSKDNLAEQKILDSAFSESLKSKILAVMLPPPGYTGFTTNLPFWAARKLERM